MRMAEDLELRQWARAAAGGDRDATERLLHACQDWVYQLAVRMLGHPQDAEDASQEILLVLLTHLGSYRGESSFHTWAWRIATNHLLRARRGRLERVTFSGMRDLLQAGLREVPEQPEAETTLLAAQVRLRCTEAMVLSLDRDLRIAFVLGDIFALSGDEAAAVLEVDAAVFRKRLSRARSRLLGFMRAQCGLYDPANRCRCSGQVTSALENGILKHDELFFARHPVRPPEQIEQYATEVTGLLRMADVIRHPDYIAPEAMVGRIRALLDSGRLELLRH
jgi:RNA polymerase sigma factor (sigma-70 family)